MAGNPHTRVFGCGRPGTDGCGRGIEDDRDESTRHGVVGEIEAARGILEQQEIVESVERRESELWVTLRNGVEDYGDLSTLLVNAGYPIRLFREDEVNLESAFMALTKGLGEKI